MTTTKIACIGAGYFAPYHLEAWQRLPGAEVVALCDRDAEAAARLAARFGVPRTFTDLATLCAGVDFAVADIITPPASHLELVEYLAQRGKDIICQKPLAPTLGEAEEIHRTCARARIRFMVHENWRFQPWYRKIRELLDAGAIGDRIFGAHHRMRMGDGWSADAYLDRQPYFRRMPRLLVHETGIHFIDTYRFLFGEVTQVYARLRTLNGNIAGEDEGLLLLDFAGGARVQWDGNRYNESTAKNPRLTFGELLVEGSGGSLRLYTDGKLTLQPLGQPEAEVAYTWQDRGFAGDSVYLTQEHFLMRYRGGAPFETGGADYLKSLAVEDAVYRSAEKGRAIGIDDPAD